MKKTKLILTFLICTLLTVLLCACAGPQGPQGEQGEKGEQGVQGEAGVDGQNGRVSEFRVNDGWLQWKYTDEADTKWQNLYKYTSTVSNPDDNSPDDDNSGTTDDVVKYSVTTNSSTDDYGLAGTYTMLNAKKFKVGDKVQLSATANKGYNFEGWYINSTLLSRELNYAYTMQSKNVTVTAKFSSYTVNTKSSTNTSGAAGTYTTLYNQRVSEGETVELKATVNEGYNFEGWYAGNICVSRDLTYNHTMEKENVIFEARYSCYRLTTVGVAVNSYGNVDAAFNGGTYTKYSNENVSAGQTVTLTATVNDGYNFVGWYVEETCVSTNLEYTFTMEKSDVTVQAVYIYYRLTTTAANAYDWNKDQTESYDYGVLANFGEFSSPAIYISPVYKDQKISVGASITVEAKDIEGYTFYAWRTNSSILCQDKTYTFAMPAGDICLFALYVYNN